MTKVKTPSSQSPFSAVIIFVFALGSAIEAVVTHPDPQLDFLPGIGPFLNPQLQATDRVSRDVFRVSRSQKPPSDSDNGDNPFVVPQGRAVEVISEPAVFSQNIEPFNPPVELADGKCSYVQMKGGPIPRAECQAGGMTCTKDCNFDKGSGPGDPRSLSPGSDDEASNNCVTVSERMCGDVPKEECETVNEKVCNQIPDETCDTEEPYEEAKSNTKCEIVEEEECETLTEMDCRMEMTAECRSIDKSVCTTIQEPVCTVTSDKECTQVPDRACRLVSDVECKEVIETKFDEECQTLDEENCKIVYDTVWENKCEMVNVTVPQKECNEVPGSMRMEKKCEILEEIITTPVCVTVTDQEVDEVCEDKPIDATCYKRDCRTGSTTILERRCDPVSDETCDAVVKEKTERKCVEITKQVVEESCRMEEQEPIKECQKDFEYVCEEGGPLATTEAPKTDYESPPSDEPEPLPSYGPPLDTSPGYGPPPNPDPIPGYGLPPIADPSPSYGIPAAPVLAGNRSPKYGERLQSSRGKRQTWPPHPGLDGVFISVNHDQPYGVYGSGREEYTRSSYGPPPPPRPSYGAPAQSTTMSTTTTTTTTTQPSIKCEYVPKENCTTRQPEPKEVCDKFVKEIPDEICVEVPTQIVDRSCRNVSRMSCDVVMKQEPKEECDLVPEKLKPVKICDYKPKPVNREVCQDVEMKAFSELCKDVPIPVPRIECETVMKQIELKEICIKVEFQLPREECKRKSRKECKYVPREKPTQRCEPSIRENCTMVMKTECQEVCREQCEDRDKKVCMMIPHQECEERPKQRCQEIPRNKCRKVPKERCSTFEKAKKQKPRCRKTSRTECREEPREACRTVVKTECRDMPRLKCDNAKPVVRENCQQKCEPVFWCKVCN